MAYLSSTLPLKFTKSARGINYPRGIGGVQCAENSDSPGAILFDCLLSALQFANGLPQYHLAIENHRGNNSSQGNWKRLQGLDTCRSARRPPARLFVRERRAGRLWRVGGVGLSGLGPRRAFFSRILGRGGQGEQPELNPRLRGSSPPPPLGQEGPAGLFFFAED